jgi:hypothetical protein
LSNSTSTRGRNTIGNCRQVFAKIDPKIRERFIEKKVMYMRNFGDGFGLPWQTVFQSTEKAKVEEYCRKNGIEFEWKEGDKLRTRQVGPAIIQHPITGEMVWFNHATFFHVSTLEQKFVILYYLLLKRKIYQQIHITVMVL